MRGYERKTKGIIMKNQALIYFFITVLFVVSLTAQSFAQTVESSLPNGVEKVTSVEGVTEYRLPNGLRTTHQGLHLHDLQDGSWTTRQASSLHRMPHGEGMPHSYGSLHGLHASSLHQHGESG